MFSEVSSPCSPKKLSFRRSRRILEGVFEFDENKSKESFLKNRYKWTQDTESSLVYIFFARIEIKVLLLLFFT